jgi:hypothetical protein
MYAPFNLSTTAIVLAALAIPLVYVLSVYAWWLFSPARCRPSSAASAANATQPTEAAPLVRPPHTTPSPFDRENLYVARRRLAGVVAVTIVIPCVVAAAVDSNSGTTVAAAMGMRFDASLSVGVGVTLALLLCLYAGELLVRLTTACQRRQRRPQPRRRDDDECGGDDFDEASSSCCATVQRRAADLRTWRDVVVGPVSEEVIFRACLVPIIASATSPTLSFTAVVFVTPLSFGLAHVHHIVGLTRGPARVSYKAAAARVAAQFVYTTLFGWFAVWLFLRWQSVFAPTAAHVFCNIMGLPDVAALRAVGIHGHESKSKVLQPALTAAHVCGVVAFVIGVWFVHTHSFVLKDDVESAYWLTS